MRVKLDENLSRAHAAYLIEHGYETDRVHDEGLSGASDEEVWRVVLQERRFFITLDLDFSDIRKFPPGEHPGILLIRARSRSQSSVQEVLERVLREQSLTTLQGCLAVADPHFTRIRRPSRNS